MFTYQHMQQIRSAVTGAKATTRTTGLVANFVTCTIIFAAISISKWRSSDTLCSSVSDAILLRLSKATVTGVVMRSSVWCARINEPELKAPVWNIFCNTAFTHLRKFIDRSKEISRNILKVMNFILALIFINFTPQGHCVTQL